MGSYADEVRSHVLAELGPDFAHDLFDLVRATYAAAALQTRHLSAPRRRKLFPTLLLVLLEEGLKSLAQRYPDVTPIESFTKKKSYRFLLVRRGSVVISASAVRSRQSLPRPAHFRTTLARGITLDLFDDESASTEGREFWFALLLHQTSYRVAVAEDVPGKREVVPDYASPAFIDLAVPARDVGRICTIDLQQECAAPADVAEEDVPATAPKRKQTPAKRRRDTDEGAA